ncbi:MAG: hypothetical protein EBV05_10185 [Cyanobacteria bacterium WB6_1B_304]|nr:hypothetical protein [Cyanobacteria bacterium WB6_1B_304]
MFTDKLGLKPRRFKPAFFTNMVKHHPMAKSISNAAMLGSRSPLLLMRNVMQPVNLYESVIRIPAPFRPGSM